MTTHYQVDDEAKMRKLEAEIDDLKEMIKAEHNVIMGYENDYKEATGDDKKGLREMIMAARTNLHDLSEDMKALRRQQQEGAGEILQEIQGLAHEIEGLKTNLEHAEIRRLRRELDCWHSNTRTVIESTGFKNVLADFYACTRTADNYLKCMLTGDFYPRHEVRASHIIKRSTDGSTMHLFGLPPQVDHARNGLLLLEPIEQAFDRKDICFLYNAISNELVAKLLNPNLKLEPMPRPSGKSSSASYTKTFGDIDGQVLQLPCNIFPYRRALSMHAKFAFSRALKFGWIADSTMLDSYFDVSDSGLPEPLGLGMLTWQEVHSSIHNI